MKKILILLSIVTSFSTFGKQMDITYQEKVTYKDIFLQHVSQPTFKCNQTSGKDIKLKGAQLDSFFQEKAKAILTNEMYMFSSEDPSSGEGFLEYSFGNNTITKNFFGHETKTLETVNLRYIIDRDYNFKRYEIFFNTNKYNYKTSEESDTITLSAICNVN